METRLNKIDDALLRKGVRKLRILGFSHVTLQTILSNEMYRLYFIKFLHERELSGNADEATNALRVRKIVEEM